MKAINHNRLTPQLAHTIVDRTMKIVDYNINVMDQNGVIIGSGNQSRINDLHEGAKQVIEQGEELRIFAEEEAELAGSKQGINLPIKFNEEIIGVVGITGAPEEVAGYGGLVKMTVELMVQQAFYLEQEQLREQAEEQFIKELISQNISLSRAAIEKQAKEMGYYLDQPYRVFILEIVNLWDKLLDASGKVVHAKFQEYKQKIKTEMRYFFQDNLDLRVAYLQEEKFVILECESEFLSAEKIVAREQRLIERMETQFNLNCKISSGNKLSGVEGIQTSFGEAKASLQTGKQFYPECKVYSQEELMIEQAADELPAYLRKKFISYLPTKRTYLQTLQIYLACDLKISETAQKLCLHRNSIVYRLQQIKKQTGLDPRCFNDALKLKLALLCREVKEIK